MATNATQTSDAPAFTFGLLADIQYVDMDDKPNFTGTQWRRYRNSLVVADDAVSYFNEHDLDFVLHNGDIIDHQCAFDFETDAFKPKEETMDQLGQVMSVLSKSKCRDWHFTVGNHELYNFTREELRDGVVAPGDDVSLPFKCANDKGNFHYSFSPSSGWRVLVLDAYDVSIYRNGREKGLDVDALNLLCQKNENCAKFVAKNPDVLQTERMSGTFPYFKDLEGLENRWVPFNGGLGDSQLKWIKDEIEHAASQNERVILFSHLLCHPSSTAKLSGRTLLWNYQELLDILENPLISDTIAALISGHQHDGGVFTSDSGTHYVVMESPIVAEADYPGPYAVVQAFGDSLKFTGFGKGKESNLFPGGGGSRRRSPGSCRFDRLRRKRERGRRRRNLMDSILSASIVNTNTLAVSSLAWVSMKEVQACWHGVVNTPFRQLHSLLYIRDPTRARHYITVLPSPSHLFRDVVLVVLLGVPPLGG